MPLKPFKLFKLFNVLIKLFVYLQGTKKSQYCTRPAGRVTYNFHSSCKHMHSSLKIVCNKENGGGAVIYITAKIIFTHCSQFHNCIPYTDKKSFTFQYSVSCCDFLFSKSRLLSAFSAGDIIAELRPSRRKINNHSNTVCQTYFIDENALRKINIYFNTVYHTTAHYIAQLLFTICNHNIRFLLSN